MKITIILEREETKETVRDFDMSCVELRDQFPVIPFVKSTRVRVEIRRKRKFVPEIDSIVKTSYDFYGIKEDEFIKQTRKRRIAQPKQISISIASEIYKYSNKEISDYFRNKVEGFMCKHDLIISTNKTVRNLMEVDRKFKSDYENILSKFK